MKVEEMQIKTYTGIRLWIATRRGERRMRLVLHPVFVLENIKVR